MNAVSEFKAMYNGNETTFKVYSPTVENYKEAIKVRNEAFVDALKSKAPLRAQINTLLRSRGEWDDEREQQMKDYNKSLIEKERQLKLGGIKLSEARKLALEMKQLRLNMQELLVARASLDNMTAEGQADNANFNSLVSACAFRVEGDKEVRHFAGVEDYILSGGSEIANQAATALANSLYNIGQNAEKMLSENQFLIKYKFVDEKLRLVNKDGHLVDDAGRLIDENGYLVDEKGELVDYDGQKLMVKEEEIKPFLDEEGQEIVEEKIVETAEGKPVKGKRKKTKPEIEEQTQG